MKFLKNKWLPLLCLVYVFPHLCIAELQPAITESIDSADLINFEHYSQPNKILIKKGLALANQHLTYLYGSSKPENKGMDCSGTMYYLLNAMDISAVPRQANQMYQWAWQHGRFYAVNSNHFNSFEFAKLKPGDLLFWTGTYNIDRDPPITHVMLYLGKNKQNEPLMFGASDGRTYHNQKMWGVSVFDFKLPDKNSSSRFVGYSCIPTFNCD